MSRWTETDSQSVLRRLFRRQDTMMTVVCIDLRQTRPVRFPSNLRPAEKAQLSRQALTPSKENCLSLHPTRISDESGQARANLLYFILWGWSASTPNRRFLSAS